MSSVPFPPASEPSPEPIALPDVRRRENVGDAAILFGFCFALVGACLVTLGLALWHHQITCLFALLIAFGFWLLIHQITARHPAWRDSPAQVAQRKEDLNNWKSTLARCERLGEQWGERLEVIGSQVWPTETGLRDSLLERFVWNDFVGFTLADEAEQRRLTLYLPRVPPDTAKGRAARRRQAGALESLLCSMLCWYGVFLANQQVAGRRYDVLVVAFVAVILLLPAVLRVLVWLRERRHPRRVTLVFNARSIPRSAVLSAVEPQLPTLPSPAE